jgi:LacI family transcriptional regulator, gluconate utilization system Gnt-I transcriptional repressor
MPMNKGKTAQRPAVNNDRRKAVRDTLPGGSSVTMAAVARLAGVSPMTVSRALRNHRSVSDDAKTRILAVVDQLGYVPNLTANVFSSQRSGFVAALISSISTSNLADTLHGLTEILDRHGLHVLLGTTDYSIDREEELIKTMLQRRPEAVVLTGGQHTEHTRKLLSRSNLVVVETWDLPTTPIGHVVGFSNARAAKEMVQHLASRGYGKIGFIGATTSRDVRGADRLHGYVDAIKTAKLCNPRIITADAPLVSLRHGGEALAQMIQQYPDTDAVLCVNDVFAVGAIMECRRRGWPVPDRIAVAGFGDFPIAEACHPRLTTVQVDCQKIGRRAGELIVNSLNAVKSGESYPPLTVMMEYSIVQREST